MRSEKMSFFFIGFGFFWMSCWSVFGSLLGARLHAIMNSADPTWTNSWERALLRSAHAHMNSMSIVMVLVGLCLNLFCKKTAISSVVAKGIYFSSLFILFGSILFGTGLLFQSFFTIEKQGDYSFPVLLTSFGVIGFVFGISVFAAIFLYLFYIASFDRAEQ